MKWLLPSLFFLPVVVFAQLEIVPADETPLVFGGTKQAIEIIFRNPTETKISSELRPRLYQVSSGALMPIDEAKPWKQLTILPGQTILENLTLEFPSVRATTEFRVRLSETERQITDVKMRVAPEKLLNQLARLTEKTPIGILDPDNQLKPLLRQNEVGFRDLESDAGFDDFHGKLVIIGPFRSKDSVPPNLRKRISAQRKESFAIVWIQPSDVKADPLLPVYLLRENESAIAIVQNDVVAKLAESPKSQLNLLRAAQLALNPDSLQWPETETP